MSKLSELQNEKNELEEKNLDFDLYWEHSQHKPPYWRLKNRCSECYKAHEIAVKRGSYLKEKIHNSPESREDYRNEVYRIN